MEKNTYPSYSVYYVEGAVMKIPYRASRRIQIDTLEEARKAAQNVTKKYKSDALVVLFTAPFKTRIVELVKYE